MPKQDTRDIALVPTAVIENGVRRVVAPGEPLPAAEPASESPVPTSSTEAGKDVGAVESDAAERAAAEATETAQRRKR